MFLYIENFVAGNNKMRLWKTVHVSKHTNDKVISTRRAIRAVIDYKIKLVTDIEVKSIT
jgi:hypothetical protein